MAKAAKKKVPKTMEELTKNFEEFEKNNETKPITKKEFEKKIKKLVKKK